VIKKVRILAEAHTPFASVAMVQWCNGARCKQDFLPWHGAKQGTFSHTPFASVAMVQGVQWCKGCNGAMVPDGARGARVTDANMTFYLGIVKIVKMISDVFTLLLFFS